MEQWSGMERQTKKNACVSESWCILFRCVMFNYGKEEWNLKKMREKKKIKKRKKVKKKLMDDDDETKMNTSNNKKMLKMGVNKRRSKNHDVGRREKKCKKMMRIVFLWQNYWNILLKKFFNLNFLLSSLICFLTHMLIINTITHDAYTFNSKNNI